MQWKTADDMDDGEEKEYGKEQGKSPLLLSSRNRSNNTKTITVYFAFFGSFSFSCAKYAKDFS